MMEGLGLVVLQVVRKAFGPGITPIMAADAYRENDDYYFFGYDTPAAARAADERAKIQRAKIRSEGSKKPHRLMVVGVPKRQNTRWLTLATGTFDCDGYEVKMARGKNPFVLFYGYDTAEEVEAAAARVQTCPQFGSKMALHHLSRPNGKLEMRDLKGASEPN